MAQTGPKSPRAHPSDMLTLADGRQVRLRAVEYGDRALLATLFARLSPESRYRRFLSAKPRLTSRELTYLTDVDQVHHVATAAVDAADGSIVGVGRYVRVPSNPGRVAEVAFVVVDELQGAGIGTALAERTVQRACANGLTLLTATTLWENRPARALLRRLRFRPVVADGYEIELQLELDREVCP